MKNKSENVWHYNVTIIKFAGTLPKMYAVISKVRF